MSRAGWGRAAASRVTVDAPLGQEEAAVELAELDDADVGDELDDDELSDPELDVELEPEDAESDEFDEDRESVR